MQYWRHPLFIQNSNLTGHPVLYLIAIYRAIEGPGWLPIPIVDYVTAERVRTWRFTAFIVRVAKLFFEKRCYFIP